MFRLFSVAVVLLMTLSAQAQKRRSINVALEVKGVSVDSTAFSYVDVGILGNISNLRGVNVQLLTYVVHENVCGLTLGAAGGYVGGNMNGLQIGTLFDMVGGSMNGAQISILPNLVSKDVKGLQLAALGNVSGAYMHGLQLSGIGNVTRHLRGWQVSGLNNIASESAKGVQLSGAVNIAKEVDKGLQLAGAVNLCPTQMRGVQIATSNYAGVLRGAQLGVLNLAGPQSSGFQIGLVNISSDSLMHKVGLVNINQNTRIQMMFFGGNVGKVNVGVRFLNHRTYSMMGLGTHYMGLDAKFSGALFYRWGVHCKISPHMRLSADGGFFHIETFENDSSTKPERLYSLQLRTNLEYQLTHRLGAFVTGGYSIARYYNRSGNQNHKPIIEAGVILF